MRKLFLVVLISMLTLPAMAQGWKVRYQGDMQVGYTVGIGNFQLNRANIHYINSVRIGRYLSTGLGVGFDIYHETGDSYYGDSSTDLAIPIYFNLRGYLPVSRITELYLSTDIGGSFGITEGMDNMSGLMVTPSVGARFNVGGDKCLSVGVGYVVQQWSDSGITVNTNGFQAKVGFSF